MGNVSRKQTYRTWILASLVSLGFLQCGLPNDSDIASTPSVISSKPDSVVFQVFDSDGFVIYYKPLRDGSTSGDEFFDDIPSISESGLRSLGYYKMNVDSIYLWTPEGGDRNPEITVKYASSAQSTDATFTVRNTAIIDKVLFRDETLVGKDKRFKNLNSGDKDLNGLNSTVYFALAAMNFHTDPQTLTMRASLPVHLGYMKLNVN
jgi:hypothetical protein